jgi:hypothetical protein
MIESNAQILLHMLERTDTIRFPLQRVLSDEVTFQVGGGVNRHNCRIWEKSKCHMSWREAVPN